MVEYLAAGVLSLFIGGVIFMVSRRSGTRSVVSQRLASSIGAPTDAQPTSLSRSKDNDLTLENIVTDPIARDLFLAGKRSSRQVRLYHLIERFALILPAVILLVSLLTASFDMKKFLFSLGASVYIYVFVRIMVKAAKRRRQKKLLKDLPDFLDLLIVCIESGLTLTAAIERVLSESDPLSPLSQEFRTMHQEFLGGLALGEACQRLTKRCDSTELSLLMSAITQSEQMGTSLGQSLRVQAAELRDKFKQRMRERANKIPVKITLPAVLMFIPMMIFVLGPNLYKVSKAFGKMNEQSTAASSKVQALYAR